MPYKDKERKREYQRNRVANERKKFFSSKRCQHCNSKKRLELDHINPTNKTSHSIWSWSLKRRNKELIKRQVLCHACHRSKTTLDQYKTLKHGTTRTLYEKYGCRCEKCCYIKSVFNAKRSSMGWR